ncbi:MAG: protein kinase [Thermoanaerobaculia bacterium]
MKGPPRDLWPKIEPILERVLELEPEARDGYLEEACGGDARLRREVDALLDADGEADHFLSGAAGDVAASFFQELDRTLEVEPSELPEGLEIGPYRVVRQLGRGGMGVVYEAEDPRLERRVALKLLPTEMASDPERLERFEREAKTVAALNHPNVVTLYSVEQADVSWGIAGGASGGTARVPFLTLELVEGKTLAELIPKRGFDLETLLDLAVPLADGVAAAHAKGVTHRDLKPANIMVTGDGLVKILDFGLAKILASALGDAASELRTLEQTAAGRVLGTPLYMSPEQVRGEPVDHRTDIFSLGIVLHEMATGERPFGGGSSADVSSAILREEPRSVTDQRADLPRHLGRIVGHCLVKARDGRYQSAKDVSNELFGLRREVESERILESAGAGAIPTPRATRRRNLIGLLAVALVAAGVSYLVTWRERASGPAQEERAPAAAAAERKMIVVLPFESLGPPEEEYFAAGMTEEITSRLAAVRSLGVISRTSAVQYDKTGKSLPEIGADLGADYVLEGTVRWAKSGSGANRVRFTPQLIRVADDTHLWAGQYDEVLEDIFAVQSEIALEVSEQLGVTLGVPEREALEARPTENLEAYQAYLRGRSLLGRIGGELRSPPAAESFERAVELDPGFVLAWAELSVVRSRISYGGKDPKKRQAARQALERAIELAPDAPEVKLADAYYEYYVERNFDRTLELLSRIDETRPNDAEALELRGYILRHQGRWEEAREVLERAAELNPRDLWLLGRLAAFVLLPLERYAEAMDVTDRAIALGPDQRLLYDTKAGIYWAWKGALVEARAALETLPAQNDFSRMMEFYQAIYEGSYPAALEPLDSMDPEWVEGLTFGRWPRALLEAWVYELQGESDLAESAYAGALLLAEAELRLRPEVPQVHSVLGYVYAGLGRKEEAIRAAKRAVEIRSLAGDLGWGSVDYLKHLAIVYTRVGEYEAALDELEILLSVPFEKISIPLVRIEPWWEPLRDHPRYRKLIGESGRPTPGELESRRSRSP